ncbi:hypothetical protein [Pseudomonas monteilii]|uniref:hypothetical protein n=1 Tax=Pseudomonas monteilii TaxID=76759 RepID=UPI0013777D23|nr:hypothetical protein [Pseudomonas monteilii]NBB07833.1 hypothetical protein [Pseudomonas monteilii]
MNDPRTKFDDAAGAAESFIHAMKRLIDTAFDGGNEKPNDYCALHLLADSAIREITEAYKAFGEMEGSR